MKRVFIAVGILVVVLVAAWALRGRGLPVEMAEVQSQTVREYIAEDAKTRLADEYLIDMPLTGTVQRISLEVGDQVEAGQCIVQLDPFDWEQQMAAAEAQIEQIRAQMTGVDVAKPKPEDLQTAQLQVEEADKRVGIASRDRQSARIAYEDAEKKFNQAKSLFEKGAISENMYDDAQRAYDLANQQLAAAELAESAASRGRDAASLAQQRLVGSVDDNEFNRDSLQAQVEALQSQLEIAKKNLEKTRILAPVSGYILEKYVEDERVMMAGSPIMKLGDISTIEIECDVLSEEVGRVDVDDPVEITGKAVGGETVMGTVKRIYPSGFMKISALGIEQQRVRTLISFDNSTLHLRPGTSLDVRIITGESDNAAAVPERATFRHEGEWAVFTVEGGRAHLTPVTVGLKNDEWAEIKEGVKPGMTVVADVKNELTDGMRVSQL